MVRVPFSAAVLLEPRDSRRKESRKSRSRNKFIYQGATLNILHLSDIHYGIHEEKSSHFFQVNEKPDPSGLFDVLKKDPDCKKVDLVVVSGDLTWSGSKEDYGYVQQFLERLKYHFLCPIIIIPGNHDVARSLPADSNQEEFYKAARKFYKEEFASYFPLIEGRNGGKQRNRFVTVHKTDDYCVVGVNSAAGLNNSQKTPIFVDPKTLDLIEEKILKSLPETLLRIFVVHHHLFPFAESAWGDTVDLSKMDKADSTIVANSAQLQGWLDRHGFHMVLHGHKHLAHGRADQLWRPTDNSGARTMFVVGAGSAGVKSHERGVGDLCGYNCIRATRAGKKIWDLKVVTKQISKPHTTFEAEEQSSYQYLSGSKPETYPHAFCSESMRDCHQTISNRTSPNRNIYNFISVVHEAVFQLPETAKIKSETPTLKQVKDSFQNLHPEWDENDRWDNRDRVNEALQKADKKYLFRHGPRLFGSRKKGASPLYDLKEKIVRNVNNSRLYVGLFDPDLDISAQHEPPPGMTGLQLIPTYEKRLDMVVTFRKLELAFWWTVNMFEAIELMNWITSGSNLKPGSITFQAAIAEWKSDPEASFIAELDRMKIAEIVKICVDSSKKSGRQTLLQLLREKRSIISSTNLDADGLTLLEGILTGLGRTGAKWAGVVESLRRAHQMITAALVKPGESSLVANKVVQELEKSIDGIEAFDVPAH